MKSKVPPFVKVSVLVLLIGAAVILLVRHFHIKDFFVVKPNVLYTSGQPRGMDYTRLLYRYHIATIVNLRQATEGLNQNWRTEEIAWARSNGVGYYELPFKKSQPIPEEAIQAEFLAIMGDKKNLPVLLHGSSDDMRVALLTGVWLLKAQNVSLEQTTETLREMLDHQSLSEPERQFLLNLKQ
jgi:protein tyrosine/serine phosphatase